MTSCRRVTVLTHQRPGQTADAMRRLVADARREGVELRFDVEEAAKHAVRAEDGVIVTGARVVPDVDLCVALGGDGTILRALRSYARTGVPVFAVNFGEVGFLATVDPDELSDGFTRAFRGEFDRLDLPAIEVHIGGHRSYLAFNDISLHRRMGDRVAELSYLLDGEEVGSVRCDGIVVCTPAGSTGYNLANGGPVMAWGVEGFGVSFIAPHSLAARSLVVAPDDGLRILSRSEHGVDLSIDGRPGGALEPGEELRARFALDAAVLAQQPGSSFYRRLREKFGRLSR
jgi:NAD+ kinase